MSEETITPANNGKPEKSRLARFLSHDCSPFEQFVKYTIVGGSATAINFAISLLLAATVFNCLAPDDFLVKIFNLHPAEISPGKRAFLSDISASTAFLISNIYTWIFDRLFVFKPGRHRWYKECALFIAGSACAFGLGLAVQDMLIRYFNIMTSIAFLVQIFTALCVNYAVRKFFVFKG